MPTSSGTKVLPSPPPSFNPKLTTSQYTSTPATLNEPTGLVTSDSLAGESLTSGGSFASNNPHAAASKQPSASTTSNTTDTSNATKLPPAVDAEAREAQQGWSETSQLNAGKGLGKEAGVGPTYNVGGTKGASGGREFDASGGATAPTGGYAG